MFHELMYVDDIIRSATGQSENQNNLDDTAVTENPLETDVAQAAPVTPFAPNWQDVNLTHIVRKRAFNEPCDPAVYARYELIKAESQKTRKTVAMTTSPTNHLDTETPAQFFAENNSEIVRKPHNPVHHVAKKLFSLFL